MKKTHLYLILGFTLTCIFFVGCGSAKPEPTAEDLKRIEKEIVAGESAL